MARRFFVFSFSCVVALSLLIVVLRWSNAAATPPTASSNSCIPNPIPPEANGNVYFTPPGQILRQTVDDTRAQTGPARLGKTCVEKNLPWCVVKLIRLHGLDQADVVHHSGEMRERLRQFRARLSVFVELELWPKHRRVRSDESVTLPRDDRRRQWFARELREFRFVIEQI